MHDSLSKHSTGSLRLLAHDKAERTLIHAAVTSQSSEVLRFFLNKGSISLNTQDNEGDTALHLAAKNGYYEAMDMLLEKGADDTIKNEPPFHLLLERDNNLRQIAFLEASCF